MKQKLSHELTRSKVENTLRDLHSQVKLRNKLKESSHIEQTCNEHPHYLLSFCSFEEWSVPNDEKSTSVESISQSMSNRYIISSALYLSINPQNRNLRNPFLRLNNSLVSWNCMSLNCEINQIITKWISTLLSNCHLDNSYMTKKVSLALKGISCVHLVINEKNLHLLPWANFCFFVI